ncbi:outer membrane beta-barrel protein, partial [Escherichia coli]|nr:outer membrane beta-barrel protein [Escherichia coli]
TAGATFDSTQKENGDRNTLRFSREMKLPAGSLNSSLGVTKFSGTGSELIGSLRWQRDLPTGSMNLRLKRDVRTASDDSDRISTTIGAGYSHAINDLSSLSFNASYGMFDSTGSSNDSSRTDLSLNYSYALTSDWNLNAGVNYRVRDEDLVGKADSTTVYVGIGRSFTVFH